MVVTPSEDLNFKVGCYNAALSILMGAILGRKANTWTFETLETFRDAQKYHYLKSLGMICSSFVYQGEFGFLWCFILGTVFHVFPLYHKVGYEKGSILQKLGPIGWISMIVAWLAMPSCI